MNPTSDQSGQPVVRQRPPLILLLAISLTAGVWSRFPAGRSGEFLPLLSLLLMMLCAFVARHTRPLALLFLLSGFFLLGAQLNQQQSSGIPDEQLPARISDTPLQCRITGTVHGLLSARGNPESAEIREQGFRFLLRPDSITQTGSTIEATGLVQVFVDGPLPDLNTGDQISAMGQLQRPRSAANPGEFDYSGWAAREGIMATFRVRHPAALQLVSPAPVWQPRVLLSRLRRASSEQIGAQLPAGNQALAEALLLGNRGLLSHETERAFARSGTLHLLAVSGLHVGILYVFVLRILHALLLPRGRSLILAMLICIIFALITDLRPSVLRATCFLTISTCAQLLRREVRPTAVLGLTLLILIAADPATALDTGAWLSFLAVAGLCWYGGSQIRQDGETPADTFLLRDRMRLWLQSALCALRQNGGRILAVSLFVSPLVVAEFHLFSLTGLVINLVLIPLTGLVLTAGFLFLAGALLLPPLGPIIAVPFLVLQNLMLWSVHAAGDFHFGYLFVPDLPFWFLPLWYLLLTGIVICRRRIARHVLLLGLLLLTSLQLQAVGSSRLTSDLLCTVLSVGHGNAIVVESDRHVLLFDAGAMNQGPVAAERIQQFLWHRGHRSVDAIIVSHADADHYNALPAMLQEIPAGVLLTSRQFVRSAAPEVQRLLRIAEDIRLPVRLVSNHDRLISGDLEVEFLQREAGQQDEGSDNENSLVAVLHFHGQRVCLPGDLELSGLDQLLPQLPTCRVLVSPHHGSTASNPPQLAARMQPEHVVVSSGNDSGRSHLQRTYPSATLYFTSRSGAVSVHLNRSGTLQVSTYRGSSDAEF